MRGPESRFPQRSVDDGASEVEGPEELTIADYPTDPQGGEVERPEELTVADYLTVLGQVRR